MIKEININLERIKVCPVCRKPVKKYREFRDKGIYVKIPIFACGCKNPQRKAVFDKKKSVDKLLRMSKIDNEFLVKDFPVTHKEIKPFYNSLKWINEGRQMLIYGGFGNLKTGHACEVMKKSIREKLWFCLYYRASRIPVEWKEEKSMMKCKLLVIDNFAKEKEENWRGSVFDLIDYRIHNKLSTILISNNRSTRGIENIYGGAMTSRLSGFIQIMMDGIDRRKDENFLYGGKS